MKKFESYVTGKQFTAQDVVDGIDKEELDRLAEGPRLCAICVLEDGEIVSINNACASDKRMAVLFEAGLGLAYPNQVQDGSCRVEEWLLFEIERQM